MKGMSLVHMGLGMASPCDLLLDILEHLGDRTGYADVYRSKYQNESAVVDRHPRERIVLRDGTWIDLQGAKLGRLDVAERIAAWISEAETVDYVVFSRPPAGGSIRGEYKTFRLRTLTPCLSNLADMVRRRKFVTATATATGTAASRPRKPKTASSQRQEHVGGDRLQNGTVTGLWSALAGYRLYSRGTSDPWAYVFGTMALMHLYYSSSASTPSACSR